MRCSLECDIKRNSDASATDDLCPIVRPLRNGQATPKRLAVCDSDLRHWPVSLGRTVGAEDSLHLGGACDAQQGATDLSFVCETDATPVWFPSH